MNRPTAVGTYPYAPPMGEARRQHVHGPLVPMDAPTFGFGTTIVLAGFSAVGVVATVVFLAGRL